MSPYPALDKLRIGCVQYLNAKPLIFGYPGKVCFDHPAKLAESLAGAHLDIALVSTFELLRMPRYLVADGVSISSKGSVYSVFLAHKGPLREIKSVSLDSASLTAAHLLKCVLAEYHGLHPSYESATCCAGENTARLLIGNQAIDFRREHGGEYEYLDLGAEWLKQTGLPFVFAAWLIREEAPDAAAAAAELRKLKQIGTGCISEIARTEGRYGSDFATHYLTEHIRYDLGPDEKAGIRQFRELLAKHGFIPPGDSPLVFI